MSAVAELKSLEADELCESLVDEACGLKRLTRSLAPQLSVGYLVQFVVDEGSELVHRAYVASAMGAQEIGDVVPIPRPRSRPAIHAAKTLLPG
jgi:hypothetical protein